MFRTLCAIALAIVFATAPVLAQQDQQLPLTSRPYTALVGLPILSSDGEKMGQLTGVEGENSERLLVGEIDRHMGIGSDEVAIPVGVYVDRGDHIELTVTAAEVRDTIARARR